MVPSIFLWRASAATVLLWAKGSVGIPERALHGIRSANGTSSFDGVGFFDLVRRDDDDPDAFDLGWIKKMAAIGDSYSAGIGAGGRLGSMFDVFVEGSDRQCGRYDKAYPYVINQDTRLGDPNGRSFEFKSCSGAVTKDVIEKQIPKISDGQQAILLSIGGNDAGLVDVLNQCIFQWGVFNPEQVALGKLAADEDPQYAWAKNIDFDKLGAGCKKQLEMTRNAISNPEFSQRLDDVLNKAKAKLGDGGKIYMTGYGKFFNADTSACDGVSWASWVKATYNNWQENEKLSKDNRRAMNELVDQMNKQLESVAKNHGEVVFINYDPYVNEFHGRYCEEGVDESTTDSNKRKGLMFYKHNTFDPWGNTPYKRTTDEEVIDTFAGTITGLVGLTRLIGKDEAKFSDNGIETNGDNQAAVKGEKLKMIKKRDEGDDLQKRGVPNLIPDGYARVFHPTVLLHEMIANQIIQTIASIHNKDALGGELIPERLTFDTCAKPPDVWRPGGGGNNEENEEKGFTWNITIYDNVECFQEDKPGVLPVARPDDNTRSRTIWGNVLDKCYTFNEEMPETDCYQEREKGKVKEMCDSGPLTPKSIAPMAGSKCHWYLEPECGTHSGSTFIPDDKRRCVDTHTASGYGKEIKSFKCMGPDK